MARNNLSVNRKKDIMLHSTPVENLFISELLPIAPGDYVKVYIFGLMNAEYDCIVDKLTASKVLGITMEEIDSAWAYWEDKGVVTREQDLVNGGYKIIFESQIEQIYGMVNNSSSDSHAGSSDEQDYTDDEDYKNSPEYIDDEVTRLVELEIRGLFTEYEEATGKPMSSRESSKIREMVNTFGVTPDVFSYAIKYCTENEKYSIDYISKVALRWKEEGCEDIIQVKELLDREHRRHSAYSRIFHELGLPRMSTPTEREMMDVWFDKWGFKLSEVLEVCKKSAGISQPNLRYVEKVLANKYNESHGKAPEGSVIEKIDDRKPADKTVSRQVLGEYYEFLRNKAEKERKEHIEEVKNIPMLRTILEMEHRLFASYATADFGPPSKKEDRDHLFRQIREVQMEKKRVLAQNGYPEDYLESNYRCKECKDTGSLETGAYCSCMKIRVEEAYKWNQERQSAKTK